MKKLILALLNARNVNSPLHSLLPPIPQPFTTPSPHSATFHHSLPPFRNLSPLPPPIPQPFTTPSPHSATFHHSLPPFRNLSTLPPPIPQPFTTPSPHSATFQRSLPPFRNLSTLPPPIPQPFNAPSHLKLVSHLLEASLEVLAAFHEVLHVVNVGEVDADLVEKVAFVGRDGQ